jgi:hypothetical protein
MDVTTVTREELLASLQSRLPELSEERLRFLYSVLEQEEAERNAPPLPQEVIDSLDKMSAEMDAGKYVSEEEVRSYFRRKRSQTSQ